MQFDWPGLLTLGLRDLGLTPDRFWDLTPAELRMMLGHDAAAGRSLTRQGFDTLMAAFPDDKKDLGHER